jgi:hypothetical protein
MVLYIDNSTQAKVEAAILAAIPPRFERAAEGKAGVLSPTCSCWHRAPAHSCRHAGWPPPCRLSPWPKPLTPQHLPGGLKSPKNLAGGLFVGCQQ